MDDFTKLRVGSPVEVEKEITYVTRIEERAGGPIYYVFGYEVGFRHTELGMVTIDRCVTDTFAYLGHTRQDAPDVLEELFFQDREGHTVSYNSEKRECRIDGGLIKGVKYLYHIYNIVESILGIQLPHYYPLRDRCVTIELAQRNFPEAQVSEK